VLVDRRYTGRMSAASQSAIHLAVVDDGFSLGPLNDLRPSFDIRTGAMTTLRRTETTLGLTASLWVPLHLEAITKERHPDRAINTLPAGVAKVLIVNGRCALPRREWLEGHDLHLGATLLEAPAARDALAACTSATHKPIETDAKHLLSRPWHWRSVRDTAINADLALFASIIPRIVPPATCISFGTFNLHAHPSVKIYPGVTFDLEHGPIVLYEGAIIRPGATLVGPCFVGGNSHILDKAFIKANTAIGPWCKVAGEVGGTIIQGYTNKGHDGHLGDSWLGEWVNLGAGTTNSNLLNTYGEVICKATPRSSNERTGEVFLGATIGDHVKTAICTRIMTGAILHLGSMFAQSTAITGTLAGFTWATDAGHKPYRLDKFLEVARAAMARRKITPSDAYVGRLSAVHTAASTH
jgi:UDP-N-acetylglucosamine diphosphorylase/glucosamine-1-phosphate N-acetyltransferase